MPRKKHPYAPYHRKYDKEEERIKRKCLKCDKGFLAFGKYNRICPICTIWNKVLVEPGMIEEGRYEVYE